MKRIIFYLILLVSYASAGQLSPTVAKYNLPKKRLLIQACSMYLFNANQGAIDVDSSVVLACKAYKLPVALAYDEGFNNGSYLIGKDLMEKGNINSVIKLLAKTKGENRIKLSLQLGNFYLFKPGTKPEDLQNAKTYIDDAVRTSNQLKDKKWQHQSLLLLGKYYYQANNQSEGKKIFSSIIAEYRKQNDQLKLAEALDAYGTLLFNQDPEKEKLLQETVSIYASLGLEEKRIENYMKITTIYFWTGKINDAKKRLYKNLVDLRKIGFTHQQFAETTIVFIELAQRNIPTALYYALKSIKRMEAERDYTFGDIFYMRLGDVYNHYGHHEEALQLYKKSIEIGQHTFDTGTWYKSFFSSVAAISLKGKTKEALEYIHFMTTKYPPKSTFDKMSVAYITANCYDQLGNFVQAEKYFKETYQYSQQINSPETFREVMHQNTVIALFYIKTKRPKEAKFYTDQVIASLKPHDIRYSSEALKLLLYKTDSINGDYKTALEHYKEYNRISDSLHGVNKNRQIDELKIQYETKNKEQEIKLLNQESNLKEVALKKSKMLNSVSIWSLVLLLITVGLLYNRYRLKQRNNVKLELKEKEISKANADLRHLLDEKEWLLKEIHHRVKNNLQTVISLLNSQSAYLENDMALSAIKNSQHRIHSMSLIHQKLYNSENISTINMPNYIKELVEYLRESFSLGQRIRFEVKVDPLELDVAQAVPLGLILNEAITNSIKYAFPNDRTGMIYITLEAKDEKQYVLTISDNGIGFDPNLNDKKANSFGMSLIRGLSDDIDGNLTMENNNGTILKIEFAQEFPLNPKRKSI
ncbi:sensor histidine kinase [Flavobacterium phragmitis]|uniref:histidine kinase n=1 Tax=Flavobacterium phragmitis TaxID=739143 RepID=A0A1I1PT06_9FLAO|nr:sensor histidine kinase [Flavobacterium phragmitis]SFD13074.1 Two-component sensor histidine kinase, contains HisKA and HATPase domains [Flavobacterium phragmitis]